MKVGVIIPYRNDRPLFFNNLKRMLKAQTMQPDIVEIINYEPINNDCDITQRYRIGYDKLRNKNLDIIALMEVDDYYAPNYLQVMLDNWVLNNKPNIFGTNYTIYYHIKLFKYYTFKHFTRASAMNTLIKPDMNFQWCKDNEPYTDMHLWRITRGAITFGPSEIISIGIKHGIGKLGGMCHIDKFDRYIHADNNKEFLKQYMDKESFEFYSNYFNSN